jgi:uncharacterized membrane protein
MMLVVTGSAHFFKTTSMMAAMPSLLPYKREIVYGTGILELVAAVALFFSKTSRITSVVLIIFFIVILPANIVGSLKKVELGGMENGPYYLIFRIPLQLFFIWWAYYFGIRKYQKKIK